MQEHTTKSLMGEGGPEEAKAIAGVLQLPVFFFGSLETVSLRLDHKLCPKFLPSIADKKIYGGLPEDSA